MLISPPFLPARTAEQLDADWVEQAMRQPISRAPMSSAFEGSFPLGTSLMWHNGIHIQAAYNPDGSSWPAVRAVAGGTIVHVSAPSTRNDAIDDPQNYNPFGSGPAWSDNGMIVIAHDAEIGASNDSAASPTAFRFYSAYMHMGSIAKSPATKSAWARGDAVDRKDELGSPGKIYGDAGQLHLEVCCDAANAAIVLNRPVGWRENRSAPTPMSDGRTDAVFGSLWFYLPVGTPTQTTQPKHHRRTISGGASAASDHFVPDTLRDARWVELRYERGDAHLMSFDSDGQPIGAPLHALRAEYDLYQEATKRNENYLNENPPAGGNVVSSPSGWYELLRFGRNLGFGGGNDPLPADAAHWRQIPTPAGTIWADLNALGTCKFSDADMLPIAGWNCYDDDTNADNQLCESPNLKRLLRHPEQRQRMAAMPARTAEADIADRLSIAHRLNHPALQTILRRAVCNFPTEWDRSTNEKRHEWMRNPLEKLQMDDPGNWERFTAHLRSISLDGLPAEYTSATWRFHPTAFIAFFRQCGWLKKSELARLFPECPTSIRETYRIPINRACRKYGINNPIRLSHFLGQGSVESSNLMLMQEAGNNSRLSRASEQQLGHWYGANQPQELDLWFTNSIPGLKKSYSWINGNCGEIDAQKFRGRGFKQLTGRSLYSQYYAYRGWLIAGLHYDEGWWKDAAYLRRNVSDMRKRPAQIDDPQRIATDDFSCIDSGAFYITCIRPKTLQKIDFDFKISSNSIETEAEISDHRDYTSY